MHLLSSATHTGHNITACCLYFTPSSSNDTAGGSQ